MKTFKFLITSAIGTYFEFFDFMLFTFAAPIIAYNFFPKHNQATNLICTWGIFAVSFIVRPLGAVFFGHLGDKFGTRYPLLISMIIMSSSTIAIGFLPNYETLGILAPLLLIFLRSLQGFSFSAEYTGASTYLSLRKDKQNLGILSSMTVVSICLGQVTGSTLMSTLTHGLTIENLPEHYWRLPFIVSGVLLGISGVLLRLNMPNLKTTRVVKAPFFSLITHQKKEIFICVLLSAFVGIKSYAIFGYLPTHLQKYLNMPLHESFDVASHATLLELCSVLLAGFISDKVGRIKVIYLALALIGISALGSFFCFQQQNVMASILWIYLLSFGSGLFSGGMQALLAEMFNQEQRYSGSAISYNIGVSLGGSTPLIMSYFVHYNQLIPGFYLAGSATLLFLILYFVSFKNTALAAHKITSSLAKPTHS